MPNFITTIDPFEAAQDFQYQIIDQPFEQRVELAEKALLILGQYSLELKAEAAQYLVECRLAVDRPAQTLGAVQRLISFGDVAIEGSFRDFAYSSIGDIRERPINTLCAMFEDVSLLPDADKLPDGDVLFVPVLAIDQKLRTN